MSEPTGAGGVALLSAPALTVGDRLQQASDRAAYLSASPAASVAPCAPTAPSTWSWRCSPGTSSTGRR